MLDTRTARPLDRRLMLSTKLHSMQDLVPLCAQQATMGVVVLGQDHITLKQALGLPSTPPILMLPPIPFKHLDRVATQVQSHMEEHHYH